MLAYDRFKVSNSYLKCDIESNLIKLNLGLIDKGYNILKEIENEDKKIQEDYGPFDTKSARNAEFDSEISNFINSDSFNDTLQGTSEDRINTVNLIIKELNKYIEENNKSTKTNTLSKPLLFLQQNQIWPYMLLHL
jgi:hypothetical protein